QTFRHTLSLAQEGRNEEALLGCDFILKMDTRFVPARRLPEALRGVPVGRVIDLAPFGEYRHGPAAAAGVVGPPIEEGWELAPAQEAAPAPFPSPAPAPGPSGAGLDDLVFDDFGSSSGPHSGMPSSFSSAAVGSVRSQQEMPDNVAPFPSPAAAE